MRLAILQMHAKPGDVEANFARIARAAREAYAAGAGLLVTPELALTGYGAGDAVRDLAEPADGSLAQRLRRLSAEERIAILTGFAERDGDVVYNSALYVDGPAPPALYRKSHLYGDYERGLFRPGRPDAVMVEIGGLKLGFLICYDVEFPENVRRLARAGARVVLVPTALPASDHAAFIAEKLIAVRAFENQIFVAYVNHCGADRNFAYAGLSRIVAPDGSKLAAAGPRGEKLLVADVRPGDYAASAEMNTYLRDLVM